ncbi:hypothetical protein EN751_21900 [Mesorhizobium sp. M4A.F.Ca.ET.029.04.2.1]|uniref:hypothetical protein n=1 Tax=Mesorhizobium sp. TaxID=1871066 RepID=UPI000FD529E6|nr:hypothetical protein [Mesorhizobium sp.]RVD70214.1 hypothetical protein EN751_21900 [Mesorhizobium sp. M4A.F.Ca.ET.029.04.2.1]
MKGYEKSSSLWPHGWILAGMVTAGLVIAMAVPVFAKDALYPHGLSDADRADNHPTDAELEKCPGIVDLYHGFRANEAPLPGNVSIEQLQKDASECVYILNENYGTDWTVDETGVQKDD